MNLNKSIVIERRGQSQDTTGQQRETWTEQARVWASIRPVSAREYFAASGQRADITHEVMMRHPAPLQPRDRIVYDGRIFDVISVFNIEEQGRYIKAMSTEAADA